MTANLIKKIISTILVVTFLFTNTDVAFALSPTSRFNPIATVERTKDGYQTVEYTPSQPGPLKGFREDAGSRYLRDLKEEVSPLKLSARGLIEFLAREAKRANLTWPVTFSPRLEPVRASASGTQGALTSWQGPNPEEILTYCKNGDIRAVRILLETSEFKQVSSGLISVLSSDRLPGVVLKIGNISDKKELSEKTIASHQLAIRRLSDFIPSTYVLRFDESVFIKVKGFTSLNVRHIIVQERVETLYDAIKRPAADTSRDNSDMVRDLLGQFVGLYYLMAERGIFTHDSNSLNDVGLARKPKTGEKPQVLLLDLEDMADAGRYKRLPGSDIATAISATNEMVEDDLREIYSGTVNLASLYGGVNTDIVLGKLRKTKAQQEGGATTPSRASASGRERSSSIGRLYEKDLGQAVALLLSEEGIMSDDTDKIANAASALLNIWRFLTQEEQNRIREFEEDNLRFALSILPSAVGDISDIIWGGLSLTERRDVIDVLTGDQGLTSHDELARIDIAGELAKRWEDLTFEEKGKVKETLNNGRRSETLSDRFAAIRASTHIWRTFNAEEQEQMKATCIKGLDHEDSKIQSQAAFSLAFMFAELQDEVKEKIKKILIRMSNFRIEPDYDEREVQYGRMIWMLSRPEIWDSFGEDWKKSFLDRLREELKSPKPPVRFLVARSFVWLATHILSPSIQVRPEEPPLIGRASASGRGEDKPFPEIKSLQDRQPIRGQQLVNLIVGTLSYRRGGVPVIDEEGKRKTLRVKEALKLIPTDQIRAIRLPSGDMKIYMHKPVVAKGERIVKGRDEILACIEKYIHIIGLQLKAGERTTAEAVFESANVKTPDDTMNVIKAAEMLRTYWEWQSIEALIVNEKGEIIKILFNDKVDAKTGDFNLEYFRGDDKKRVPEPEETVSEANGTSPRPESPTRASASGRELAAVSVREPELFGQSLHYPHADKGQVADSFGRGDLFKGLYLAIVHPYGYKPLMWLREPNVAGFLKFIEIIRNGMSFPEFCLFLLGLEFRNMFYMSHFYLPPQISPALRIIHIAGGYNAHDTSKFDLKDNGKIPPAVGLSENVVPHPPASQNKRVVKAGLLDLFRGNIVPRDMGNITFVPFKGIDSQTSSPFGPTSIHVYTKDVKKNFEKPAPRASASGDSNRMSPNGPFPKVPQGSRGSEGTIVILGGRKYRIIEEIRDGIRKAEDLENKKIVAIKRSIRGPEARETEARIIDQVKHPVIVSGFSVRDDSGQAFVVTKWIDGETFYNYVQKFHGQRVRDYYPAVLNIIIALAEAVEYLHQHGISQNDLDWENDVIIDKSGHPYIIDFDQAYYIENDSDTRRDIVDIGVMVFWSAFDGGLESRHAKNELNRIHMNAHTGAYKNISELLSDLRDLAKSWPTLFEDNAAPQPPRETTSGTVTESVSGLSPKTEAETAPTASRRSVPQPSEEEQGPRDRASKQEPDRRASASGKEIEEFEKASIAVRSLAHGGIITIDDPLRFAVGALIELLKRPYFGDEARNVLVETDKSIKSAIDRWNTLHKVTIKVKAKESARPQEWVKELEEILIALKAGYRRFKGDSGNMLQKAHNANDDNALKDIAYVENVFRRTMRYLSNRIDLVRDRQRKRRINLNKATKELMILRRSYIELHLGELPLIEGNRENLQNIIYELVSNAHKHNYAKPDLGIVFTTEYDRNLKEVVIKVQDNGREIDKTLLEEGVIPGRQKIFDLNITTSDKGTGLGLCEAWHVVRGHGGTITAANRPEGGAIFTIRLPVVGAAASETLTSDSGSTTTRASEKEVRPLFTRDEGRETKDESRASASGGVSSELGLPAGRQGVRSLEEDEGKAVLSPTSFVFDETAPLYFDVLQNLLEEAFGYVLSFMEGNHGASPIGMFEINMASALPDWLKTKFFEYFYYNGRFERDKSHLVTSTSWRPINLSRGTSFSTSKHSSIASLIRLSRLGMVFAWVWQPLSAGTVAIYTPSSSRSITTGNTYLDISTSSIQPKDTTYLAKSQTGSESESAGESTSRASASGAGRDEIATAKEMATKFSEIKHDLLSTLVDILQGLQHYLAHNKPTDENAIKQINAIVAEIKTVIKELERVSEEFEIVEYRFAQEPDINGARKIIAKLPDEARKIQSILEKAYELADNIPLPQDKDERVLSRTKARIKIAKGRFDLFFSEDEVKPFDLAELVAFIADTYRIMFNDEGIIIETDIQDGLPLISGNIYRFHSAIENLVLNAQDAIPMKQNGKIVIKVWREGSNIFIRVSDNGIDIPSENLPYLFERGWTTKEDGTSRGQGLAIVKKAVENYNGTITVASRHIDEYPIEHGTDFTINLPLAADSTRASASGRRVPRSFEEGILQQIREALSPKASEGKYQALKALLEMLPQPPIEIVSEIRTACDAQDKTTAKRANQLFDSIYEREIAFGIAEDKSVACKVERKFAGDVTAKLSIAGTLEISRAKLLIRAGKYPGIIAQAVVKTLTNTRIVERGVEDAAVSTTERVCDIAKEILREIAKSAKEIVIAELRKALDDSDRDRATNAQKLLETLQSSRASASGARKTVVTPVSISKKAVLDMLKKPSDGRVVDFAPHLKFRSKDYHSDDYEEDEFLYYMALGDLSVANENFWTEEDIRKQNLASIIGNIPDKDAAIVLGCGNVSYHDLRGFKRIILIDLLPEALREAWKILPKDMRQRTYLFRLDVSWVIKRFLPEIEGILRCKTTEEIKQRVRKLLEQERFYKFIDTFLPSGFADLVIVEKTYVILDNPFLEYLEFLLKKKFTQILGDEERGKEEAEQFFGEIKESLKSRIKESHLKGLGGLVKEGGYVYITNDEVEIKLTPETESGFRQDIQIMREYVRSANASDKYKQWIEAIKAGKNPVFGNDIDENFKIFSGGVTLSPHDPISSIDAYGFSDESKVLIQPFYFLWNSSHMFGMGQLIDDMLIVRARCFRKVSNQPLSAKAKVIPQPRASASGSNNLPWPAYHESQGRQSTVDSPQLGMNQEPWTVDRGPITNIAQPEIAPRASASGSVGSEFGARSLEQVAHSPQPTVQDAQREGPLAGVRNESLTGDEDDSGAMALHRYISHSELVLRARMFLSRRGESIEQEINRVVRQWGGWEGRTRYMKTIYRHVSYMIRWSGVTFSNETMRRIMNSIIIMPDAEFREFSQRIGPGDAFYLKAVERLVFSESTFKVNGAATDSVRHELFHMVFDGDEVAAYALGSLESIRGLLEREPAKIERLLKDARSRIASLDEKDRHGLDDFTPYDDYNRDFLRGLSIAIETAKLAKEKGEASAKEYLRVELIGHMDFSPRAPSETEFGEGATDEEKADRSQAATMLEAKVLESSSSAGVMRDVSSELVGGKPEVVTPDSQLLTPNPKLPAPSSELELRASTSGAVTDEAQWGEIVADKIKLLAFEAKKRNEMLLIALESNGWIPQEQKGMIQPLFSEFDRLEEYLKRLGLGNVKVTRGTGDGLAKAIAGKQKEFNILPKNIVVLASTETLGIVKSKDGPDKYELKPSAFDFLRSTESEEKALLAGIDIANIKEFNYIRLLEMLTIALKRANGETIAEGDHPNISINESLGKRIICLIPKAEPVDANELKRIYDGQAASLRAA